MSLDLDTWLKKAHAVKTRAELLRLLDDFRPLSWTDEQRAAMSRVYMRVLEKLPPGEDTLVAPKPAAAPAESAPAATKAGDDGPVWYEKM
jgi:hypothetical protein